MRSRPRSCWRAACTDGSPRRKLYVDIMSRELFDEDDGEETEE
ncbi:MAG: hypothetical protein ACLTV6_06690 [Christensenellales bacterium]